MQITGEKRGERKRRALHSWASPGSRRKPVCQPSPLVRANLCSVQNTLQVCELMPGISALFKVIYLGGKPGYSILLWHEEITISAGNLHYELELVVLCNAAVDRVSAHRSPAGLITCGDGSWAESTEWNTSKHQQAPSKHAKKKKKVCNGGELLREIRFPVQKSGPKPALRFPLFLLSTFLNLPSSSPPPPFLSLFPSASSHLLCSLHPSLAALLPKEELSHGFPEPAVMLKL